jgi:hypothetical protein
MASWYRIAYPDHSVGSLSSSGVVNCIIDFPEFDEQVIYFTIIYIHEINVSDVRQVSAAIGNRCSDQIKRINAAFEKTIQSQEGGWDYSLGLFSCEKDMWKEDFFYMIADSW